MKIMLLSAANNIHTVRWANAFIDKGHEVIVVSCKNHKESVNKFDSRVKLICLHFSAGIGYYFNKIQLKKIIKCTSPDIINVHYASGYGTLARVSKLNNYILNLWGSDIYIFPKTNIINKRILIKNLKYAPYIASTSECMALEAKKYTKKDIFITPFGVDTKKIQYFKRDNSTNTFRICTVKTLEQVYGIDFLIKAINYLINEMKIENQGLNIEYDVYGKGNLKDSLNNLIKLYNLQDRVFLKGYIANDKLNSILQQYDLFILGSRSESFGVSALEAMANGLPVVATDTSGFSEVISNGYDGFIVPIDNCELMAKKIYELITDNSLRQYIGFNARKSVEEKYDWDSNVQKMLDIFKKII